jgi:glycosyltransferase involved in cell wall biosynthesis
MRIGIDARLSGTQHAGIGRYTQNLLQQLLKIDNKNKFVYFFSNQNQADEVLDKYKSAKNLKIVFAPIKHYTLLEQLKMPGIFSKENLDVLHVPHFNIPIFYRKKMVVTIHDLLWHQYKGWSVTTLNPVKYLLKYAFYRLVVRLAIIKSSLIIVPANTIKNTIIKFYPKSKNKIVVTKEGAFDNKSEIVKTKTTKQLKNTLLYVGSLYPHKNIRLILESLKSIPQYKLLIVGSRSAFRNRTMKLVEYKDIADQVEFLGYVDDQQLKELYQSVTCLVQPSFSEGFGLTGIEAMSLGTPVLASDIPIFKEIYQNHAYYFSPFSSASFIQALYALETDMKKTQEFKKGQLRSVAFAKTYDWGLMAKETLEVYKHAP